jgi:hypothetical protein
MDEKFFDFRNKGRPWRVRLQRLLYAVLFLSSQTSYVLSFNFNIRKKIAFISTNRPGLKGRADHFDRHPFLHAMIADDSYVEDTESECIDTSSSFSTTHIVFPGGGIFFYYQAGLVNFLRERYDLSTCTFSGASAGALTATLTAADVDFCEATDLALKLAENAGVWDRTGGLQGIWGPLIEEWLDSLLPTCIDTLQDRITLLVTPIPSFGKTKISRFENRKDLIHCNMASVHLVSNNAMAVLRSEIILKFYFWVSQPYVSSESIGGTHSITIFEFKQPWFLDGNLTSNFRGRPHIDGSFLSKEDDYSPNFEKHCNATIDTIYLDWSKDPEMSSKGGIDIVEALSPEGIYGLMERGKRYGKVMEDQGMFDSLKKLT